jgi:hypothetical protein
MAKPVVYVTNQQEKKFSVQNLPYMNRHPAV